MARATFPHQKGGAVPVRPIFKVRCSECPNFLRFEHAKNAVEVMRRARDEHGWMWVSFGVCYCPACRPSDRTFPDWPAPKEPEPAPEPSEFVGETATEDEEGVTWL